MYRPENSFQIQQQQLPPSVQILNPRAETNAGAAAWQPAPVQSYRIPTNNHSLYSVPQPEIQERKSIDLKDIQLPRGVYQVPVEQKKVCNSFKIENGINEFYGAEQPSVYDRAIYANKGSRLKQYGDVFRGDLIIKPRQGDLWQVAANPATDLNMGVLNILGGDYNENQTKLSNLMQELRSAPNGVHY